MTSTHQNNAMNRDDNRKMENPFKSLSAVINKLLLWGQLARDSSMRNNQKEKAKKSLFIILENVQAIIMSGEEIVNDKYVRNVLK